MEYWTYNDVVRREYKKNKIYTLIYQNKHHIYFENCFKNISTFVSCEQLKSNFIEYKMRKEKIKKIFK